MAESQSACVCNKALWIEFKLCEVLDRSKERACARVLRYWQGAKPPSDKCGNSPCDSSCEDTSGSEEMPAVCVYNLSDGNDGYVFEGEEGDTGLASYDDIEDKYRIVVWKSCIRAS
jgi:hypothetical protein